MNTGRNAGAEVARFGRDELYDLVGFGFGPANMSLAIILEEAEAQGQGLKSLFLEARHTHAWHPAMMLEGSLIQITALKDLITVHNPCSRFTFLNYLKQKGRLFDFLNLRDLFPTRIEYNDYLCWVAAELGDRVRNDKRVVGVTPRPAGSDGVVRELEVAVVDGRTGRSEGFRTRNVVIATGGIPVAPRGIELSPNGRAIHSHYFLDRMRRDFPDRSKPYRFVVMGSGQSAAELFLYLIQNYPNSDVTATVRRFAYKPVDESDFTNRIFFPEWVDYYYDLPREKRQAFFEDLKDVNYAVVDHALIKRINRTLYDLKAEGRNRARMIPFLELTAIEELGDAVRARYRDVMNGEQHVFTADAMIVCSGYEWPKRHPALSELDAMFHSEGEGYRMERDYSITSTPELTAKVFLQGYNEASHGISETVLSLVPVRADKIFQSIWKSSEPARSREGAGENERLLVAAGEKA